MRSLAQILWAADPKVDVIFGATYSPGRKSLSQPSTRLYATGIRFHMRPLPAAAPARRSASLPVPTPRWRRTSSWDGSPAR